MLNVNYEPDRIYLLNLTLNIPKCSFSITSHAYKESSSGLSYQSICGDHLCLKRFLDRYTKVNNILRCYTKPESEEALLGAIKCLLLEAKREINTEITQLETLSKSLDEIYK